MHATPMAMMKFNGEINESSKVGVMARVAGNGNVGCVHGGIPGTASYS